MLTAPYWGLGISGLLTIGPDLPLISACLGRFPDSFREGAAACGWWAKERDTGRKQSHGSCQRGLASGFLVTLGVGGQCCPSPPSGDPVRVKGSKGNGWCCRCQLSLPLPAVTVKGKVQAVSPVSGVGRGQI